MSNIHLRAEDILSALGYTRASASEYILDLARAQARACEEMLTPQTVYRLVKIRRIADDTVFLETGAEFHNPAMAQSFNRCGHVLAAVMTVGGAIDRAIAEATQGGDELAAMMIHAAGTAAVGHYGRDVWHSFVRMLRRDPADLPGLLRDGGEDPDVLFADGGFGMTGGFCPGEKGWDLTAQRTLFSVLDTDVIGVTLTDSCLMVPSKTVSIVYGIGAGIPVSRSGHNCAGCEIADCIMRDDGLVTVRVHHEGGIIDIQARKGTRLLDVLREHDIYIDASCDGRGTCGTCRVRFVSFIPPETEPDRRELTPEEIEAGYRLTCRVVIAHPLELHIPRQEGMAILATDVADPQSKSAQPAQVGQPGFAVDIGTTTVVAYLVDRTNGAIVDTIAQVNRQRQFGADVASRIHYAMGEPRGKDNLQRAIAGQVDEMIAALIKGHQLPDTGDWQTVAVGNTVMSHTLLGYDTAGLGVAPYTPFSLKRATLPGAKIGLEHGGDLTVMEGIAAYVGSDISVGAALCGIMDGDEYSLFLDLGTNGEIVLGNDRQLFCCSTAAGPAFEAVNIESGTGGVPGAISRCRIGSAGADGLKIAYETIGDKAPIGICGSGVLDILARLVEAGVVDRTGRMMDAAGVREDARYGRHIAIAGGIVFTQKDIREVQLAKGAIAAGIRILLDAAGIGYGDVARLYIAGGFGNHMDIGSAAAIGLIPGELSDRVISAGNTAGKGAVKVLTDPAFADTVHRYAEKASYIELAETLAFQEYFIEEMGL